MSIGLCGLQALLLTCSILKMSLFSIAGASPEELVSVRDGIIQTTPIAGTRRLGEGRNEEELIEDLMKDEKELAEHMMLVDLGRNDLGSVAKASSVNIKELKVPKKFPNLIHITSAVAGEISEGLDSIHVLRKMFPAGTLSGAPKIRAMEIIDELESSRRGLYGGFICTIDHMGNFESCICDPDDCDEGRYCNSESRWRNRLRF